jgi:N-acetylmuramoyl-L-alanine amidase
MSGFINLINSHLLGNKGIKTGFILVVFILTFFLSNLSCVYSTTLTNKDVERLRQQVEKNNPKPRNTPGVPTVPSASGSSGVPVVPGAGSQNVTTGGAMIIKKHLPFTEWEQEYREYFQQYYRTSDLTLKPRMITLHYSGTENFARLWHTFVNGGVYDGKKGHLSVHFVVDKDGSIYELMPLNRKSRGTYGVNHVTISINLIGRNEQELISNNKQLRTSFALVRWLMKRYNIPKEKVLAHTEVAIGKELVPEYTDFYDTKFPDHYPPGAHTRGPGRSYMYKLRYFLLEH